MSWDIILFNSRQKIHSVDEVDDCQLEPIDFCSIIESQFTKIIKDENHVQIIGHDFTIEYFIDDDKVSNKMVNLYGENGLYELVLIARKYNWQIFDTSLEQMINLEDPSNNGFNNFQNYLKQILNDKSESNK